MSSLLKVLLRASLLACVLVVAVARPMPAAAATPCWKTLLNDWYDGRISGTYQIHCYTDALKHLPTDVSTYSSAHDDILRALQSARTRDEKRGITPGPNTLVPPGPAGKGGKGSGPTLTGTDARGRQQGKGLSNLADKLNPSSPSSLPVPLLVLGALAILLVAAGGAGLLFKRLQARKPGH